MQTASLIERFAAELRALSGEVVLCRAEELADQISTFLKAQGIATIQAWEAGYLPVGLLERLQLEGITITHQPAPAIRAGLTGAAAGIAETGTLLLPGGPGRQLTASLLTEIHLAVLRASDIRATVAQVLTLEEIRQSPAAVLVTGPSRTGDIEMSLTIGVHGPGRVVVFCCEDA
jgi:L-lactate dehydrogenase complex protein LldG